MKAVAVSVLAASLLVGMAAWPVDAGAHGPKCRKGFEARAVYHRRPHQRAWRCVREPTAAPAPPPRRHD
ncbi:MAG: hypothetical protein ACHP7N_09240 [Caulobacterales bacterium]